MLGTSAGIAMSDIGSVLGKLGHLAVQSDAAQRQIIENLLRSAGVGPQTPVQFNPFLPDVHRCPYRHYHAIQAENPVHWSAALQCWVVSRYADVAAALHDPRLSARTGARTVLANVPSDERSRVAHATAFLASLLNEIDPPEHTRLRRAMTRALTTTIRSRPLHIQEAAHQLVSAAQSTGRMDVVTDLAAPMPMTVAAELIAWPVDEQEDLRRLVRDAVDTFADGFSQTPAMARGETAVTELGTRLSALCRDRRVRPGLDLISALLAIDGLTDAERVLMAANVVLGTQENVTHAISLLVRTLIERPALRRQLVAQPQLMAKAVDESLRYEGSSPLILRMTTAPTTLGGVTIPSAQPVALLLAAANRDPERFPAPDEFDLNRRRRHLAFGTGPRACPGAGLARQLVTAALNALLPHMTDPHLTGEPVWCEQINVHGFEHLPIALSGDSSRSDDAERHTAPHARGCPSW